MGPGKTARFPINAAMTYLMPCIGSTATNRNPTKPAQLILRTTGRVAILPSIPFQYLHLTLHFGTRLVPSYRLEVLIIVHVHPTRDTYCGFHLKSPSKGMCNAQRHPSMLLHPMSVLQRAASNISPLPAHAMPKFLHPNIKDLEGTRRGNEEKKKPYPHKHAYARGFSTRQKKTLPEMMQQLCKRIPSAPLLPSISFILARNVVLLCHTPLVAVLSRPLKSKEPSAWVFMVNLAHDP
ncbi:hypothetical protein SODALDRAFT_363213 [Sodiomyces alkalinus F11]|uniref:Uncharacterized protein n=1 Tax=Sodiomyces alkalinus (strain CBS 110278 / VKM F-3762 / F11) TaxID=1314773 RepID=A0A3N2PLV3_SODAK|nr:hypothetical protein SODALDRAFT_363213 [Sodiomyces alkalinus F11]ROT35390.1 hypothetical protein SODALDRAFT_363213 [Sodiomyces alkalinus F11]